MKVQAEHEGKEQRYAEFGVPEPDVAPDAVPPVVAAEPRAIIVLVATTPPPVADGAEAAWVKQVKIVGGPEPVVLEAPMREVPGPRGPKEEKKWPPFVFTGQWTWALELSAKDLGYPASATYAKRTVEISFNVPQTPKCSVLVVPKRRQRVAFWMSVAGAILCIAPLIALALLFPETLLREGIVRVGTVVTGTGGAFVLRKVNPHGRPVWECLRFSAFALVLPVLLVLMPRFATLRIYNNTNLDLPLQAGTSEPITLKKHAWTVMRAGDERVTPRALLAAKRTNTTPAADLCFFWDGPDAGPCTTLDRKFYENYYPQIGIDCVGRSVELPAAAIADASACAERTDAGDCVVHPIGGDCAATSEARVALRGSWLRSGDRCDGGGAPGSQSTVSVLLPSADPLDAGALDESNALCITGLPGARYHSDRQADAGGYVAVDWRPEGSGWLEVPVLAPGGARASLSLWRGPSRIGALEFAARRVTTVGCTTARPHLLGAMTIATPGFSPEDPKSLETCLTRADDGSYWKETSFVFADVPVTKSDPNFRPRVELAAGMVPRTIRINSSNGLVGTVTCDAPDVEVSVEPVWVHEPGQRVLSVGDKEKVHFTSAWLPTSASAHTAWLCRPLAFAGHTAALLDGVAADYDAHAGRIAPLPSTTTTPCFDCSSGRGKPKAGTCGENLRRPIPKGCEGQWVKCECE